MKKSDFYYELPPELIAQTPVEPRDSSRMMVYNKQTKEIELKHFYDIVDYLSPNGVLVFNRSKVIPARIPYKVIAELELSISRLLLFLGG